MTSPHGHPLGVIPMAIPQGGSHGRGAAEFSPCRASRSSSTRCGRSVASSFRGRPSRARTLAKAPELLELLGGDLGGGLGGGLGGDVGGDLGGDLGGGDLGGGEWC